MGEYTVAARRHNMTFDTITIHVDNAPGRNLYAMDEETHGGLNVAPLTVMANGAHLAGLKFMWARSLVTSDVEYILDGTTDTKWYHDSDAGRWKVDDGLIEPTN